MFDLEFWELASYIVTVVGFPAAIVIFFYEQRRERRNEEDEVYQLLSNAYTEFLRVVLDNPDLRLLTQNVTTDLNPQQQERIQAIFEMLISLLERAYLTAWSPNMTEGQRRRWNSWEDFMRQWLQRDDFFMRLPVLLRGEDPEFAAYMRALAHKERGMILTVEMDGPSP